MRGTTDLQVTMLPTLTSDSLIPSDHPIRRIKPIVEAILAELEPEFDAMYAATGWQSVSPEQLLKATVLMALYSIRSERQFCERLRYDLLFKYFPFLAGSPCAACLPALRFPLGGPWRGCINARRGSRDWSPRRAPSGRRDARQSANVG
jgi:hypothetical protein